MTFRPTKDFWNYIDLEVFCDNKAEIEISIIKKRVFVFLAVLVLTIVGLLLLKLDFGENLISNKLSAITPLKR